MEGIDPVKILYAVGVVLGVVAVFYFGFQLLENLSPTTTAAVLFLGFVVFLLAGLYAKSGSLSIVFYTLSAGSYLVFVAYVLDTYDLGDGGVFLLLAGSSALFVALGYASSEGYLDIDRRTASGAAAVVVVLIIALLAVDATGGQPAYTHDFESEFGIPDDIRDESVVGETTAENPFFLSRRADLPSVNGCLYTPELRPVSVRHADAPYDLLLAGGGTRTFNVTVGADAFFDGETRERRDAFTDREAVPVEVAETCPETADEPKLVIATGGDTPERPVP